jgi:hypothetical protein
MDVLFNPQTDRQRRTRDAVGALAAYGAGSIGRRMFEGKPRTSRAPPPRATAAQVVRLSHELKNLSASVINASIAATYTPYPLNLVTQGTNANDRTGRRIRMERLLLTFDWVLNPSAPRDEYRVLVVYDKESRGSAPALSDVLTNTASTNASLISSYNQDNANRFVICFDKAEHKTATVCYHSADSFSAAARWSHAISVPPNVHFYNTSAGTIADVDSGSLYMFVIGLTPGGYYSSYSFDTQMYFRDI